MRQSPTLSFTRYAVVTAMIGGTMTLAGCAFDDAALTVLETDPTQTDTGLDAADRDDADAGSVCGDGIRSPGEQCDDGNNVPGDGCSPLCRSESAPACGDGNLDPSEQCDDGNTTNGDGCSSSCRVEASVVCGDGILDSPEGCDDGNAVSEDGCSATCAIEEGWNCLEVGAACAPICADGIEVGAELESGGCDDGNRRLETCPTTDDCLVCGPDCEMVPGVPLSTECGDGEIEGEEECDDGPDNRDDCGYSVAETPCEVCTTACRLEQGDVHYCGDGRIDHPPETCDAGGDRSCGYGEETCDVCNATCTGTDTVVGPYCGDLVVQGPEECDGGIFCDDECHAVCPYVVDREFRIQSNVHLWILESSNVVATSRNHGTMTLRFTSDAAGVPVEGPVSLVSFGDDWEFAAVAYSLTLEPLSLEYRLVGERDGEGCPIASGYLHPDGVLVWDTCEVHEPDFMPWTPVEGADGAGCIASFRQHGTIACSGTSEDCASLMDAPFSDGQFDYDYTWNQPLNGLRFSSSFTSFSTLNTPFGAPDDLFGDERQWGTEMPDLYYGARTFFSMTGSGGRQVGAPAEQCSADPSCP